MWLREFMLPFPSPSKRLNKGWEMICSLEKCSIFQTNAEQPLQAAECFARFHLSFFCRLLSHRYRGLFEYPSATLVYPPKRNTINHAVTQSTHECQTAGGLWRHTVTPSKRQYRGCWAPYYLRRVNFIQGRSKDFKVQECISHCSL